MITYEVNRAELELVEKKLGDMKSKAPQVFKNAVNKTARQARKRIAQSARQTEKRRSGRGSRHRDRRSEATGQFARRKSVQAQWTGDAEGRQRQTPGQSVPFKLRSKNG